MKNGEQLTSSGSTYGVPIISAHSGSDDAMSQPFVKVTLMFIATVLILLSVGAAAASAAPTAVLNEVTEVGYASATFSGEVENASAEPREWEILLYKDADHTEQVARADEGRLGPHAGRISFSVPGRKLPFTGTTYYPKLVIFSLGSSYREEAVAEPFATKPGTPPTASLSTPYLVTATSATFKGEISTNSPEPAPASHDVELGFATSWEIKCVDGHGCFGGGGTNYERLPADTLPHQVEGTLTGLEAATTYEVSMVAGNASGEAQSQIVTFTTLAAPPVVRKTYWGGSSETDVKLSAVLNPEGAATTARFQVVTAGAFAESGFTTATETPAQQVAAGAKDVVVSADVGGLEPATAYRFRVLATNSVGSVEGPATPVSTRGPENPLNVGCGNEEFRVGLAGLLPDCRAYEQATPVDKNGGNAEGIANYIRAAEGGDGITFYSQAGIPGGEGSANTPTFLATRGGSAWTTQGLLPPQALGNSAKPLGYSDDLHYVVNEVVRAGTGVGLFMKDTTDGTQTTIVPPEDNPTSVLTQYGLDGISEDGNVVYFESPAVLVSGAGASVDHLYVWQRATAQVTLAGVLPSKLKPAGGSFGGAYNWPEGNLSEGGSLARMYVTEAHAASLDGNQIYFTVGGTGQLYLRKGVTGATPATVAVSASQKTNGSGSHGTDPSGPQPAQFVEATPTGSSALFMSSEELTNDANTGAADEGKDLYQYDSSSGLLTDLTPDQTDPDGADVQGVLGASDTGASVYFVARGILASGGEAGEENLYHYERVGSEATTTFVAMLESGSADHSSDAWSDALDWSPGYGPVENVVGHIKTARVSEDGSGILFRSRVSLTGFDNESAGCVSNARTDYCPEFFRYTATTQTLDCVSCDPSGSAPLGEASLSSEYINASIGDATQTKAQLQTRNFSADGEIVFFQSPDPLVPRDMNGSEGCPSRLGSNGTLSCQDVYEWEAPGAPGGSCSQVEVNGGCLFLLSSGTSSQPSFFGDADREGKNAFIFTQSRLVPVDRDELYDVYDVREEGGLSSQQTIPGPPCSAEAECLESAPASTPGATPGSQAYVGRGNGKQVKPCKKGWVRKHGRCVRKPRKHPNRKKRHKSSDRQTRTGRNTRHGGSSRKGGSR